MAGGATGAFVSRRLRSPPPRTRRQHAIGPSGIQVGRPLIMGHHHRVRRLISPSSMTRQTFGFSPLSSWYQKFSIRSNTRNDLLLARLTEMYDAASSGFTENRPRQ